MYLVVQRVSHPSGAEGINAFHYVHYDDDWVVPPHPDEDPGHLVNENVVVPPPGNRVRSYLDIVAPDNAAWSEIRQALLAFLLDHESEPMPWIGTSGRMRFRIGMDQALAQNWSSEATALYQAAKAIRLT
jgi:hypothetical protein